MSETRANDEAWEDLFTPYTHWQNSKWWRKLSKLLAQDIRSHIAATADTDELERVAWAMYNTCNYREARQSCPQSESECCAYHVCQELEVWLEAEKARNPDPEWPKESAEAKQAREAKWAEMREAAIRLHDKCTPRMRQVCRAIDGITTLGEAAYKIAEAARRSVSQCIHYVGGKCNQTHEHRYQSCARRTICELIRETENSQEKSIDTAEGEC